jgi:nucleobase:cation symporter-1, NCS1 family
MRSSLSRWATRRCTFPGQPALADRTIAYLLWLGWLTRLSCSVVAANVENLYGSFLTALTGISATGRIAPGPVMRGVATFVVAVVGTVIAILASAHFITDLTNFVLFLLYLLIPWTAINLTDYYLVRRGQYSIPDIFAEDGGVYGRLNAWALAIFVATILLELPFMSSALYTGPLVKHLGGADISWIVGLTFAIAAYYFVARWELRREPTPKPADVTGTPTPGS